jgi:pseudouridine-5'-phosphate glycosidase/pseudouridine kinase
MHYAVQSVLQVQYALQPYRTRFYLANLKRWLGTQPLSSLIISPEVQRALAAKRPVVCLESTIITHGMAYPQNLEMARDVERVIRNHGATPATIAVMNGKAHVGLQEEDLKLLASTGPAARKVSRRDLATILADKAIGGTTVSATMILAKRAGIKVFVTGGIGGVHRNGETTMDISNDLNELSRNDVAVVCAGPKAILDIPRTLEYLETMGVTVTTIGQENLPAFYSSDSGIKSPQSSLSPEHAAEIIAANHALELGSAVLCCVPIPSKAGLDGRFMDSVIRKAVADSEARGIKGKDSTPFLLAAVSKATKGRSLEANIALVMENARVGAQIAVHLARIENDSIAPAGNSAGLDLSDSKAIADSLFELEDGRAIGAVDFNGSSFAEALIENQEAAFIKDPAGRSPILAIGGVAVDVTCSVPRPTNGDLTALLATSNPGKTSRSLGGVAANIASAVRKAGQDVSLLSKVGSDVDGSFALEQLRMRGVNTSNVEVSNDQRTATYINIQADGQLVTAVADMDILRTISDDKVDAFLKQQRGGWAIVDANLEVETFINVIRAASAQATKVCFEPTSVAKAKIAFSTKEKLPVFPGSLIDTVTPNMLELKSLNDAARSAGHLESDEWWKVINAMSIMSSERGQIEHFVRQFQRQADVQSLNLLDNGIMQQCLQLLPFMPNIYLTLGQHGVLSVHLSELGIVDAVSVKESVRIEGHSSVVDIIHHITPKQVTGHESDTGAGDTFAGALVAALDSGKDIVDAVKQAQLAAIAHLNRSTR